MKYDIIVTNASPFFAYGVAGKKDIGIKEGYIQKIADQIDRKNAQMVIDADGSVVVPGFVDSHMHIDTAFMADEDDVDGLQEACGRSLQELINYYGGWSRERIVEDMMERGEVAVKKCIENGTSAIRTHVSLNSITGTAGLKAMNQLKKKYENKLDILITADYTEGMEAEWKKAAALEQFDFVGGYPNECLNQNSKPVLKNLHWKKDIDRLFNLAQEYGLPMDIHCDESDEPDFQLFRYIGEETWRRQMGGLVTVSNVTALAAKGADEEAAADAIAWCAKGSVHVTTETSQNLFLMSEAGRGTTRVRQMRNAGVKISSASDHVRDAFRPFGNCDPLEEVLLTAQVHKFGTDHELTDIMRMITYFPAESCMLQEYGLLPGCQANLCILQADSIAEAVRSLSEKKYVLHKGNIVAVNGKLI